MKVSVYGSLTSLASERCRQRFEVCTPSVWSSPGSTACSAGDSPVVRKATTSRSGRASRASVLRSLSRSGRCPEAVKTAAARSMKSVGGVDRLAASPRLPCNLGGPSSQVRPLWPSRLEPPGASATARAESTERSVTPSRTPRGRVPGTPSSSRRIGAAVDELAGLLGLLQSPVGVQRKSPLLGRQASPHAASPHSDHAGGMHRFATPPLPATSCSSTPRQSASATPRRSAPTGSPHSANSVARVAQMLVDLPPTPGNLCHAEADAETPISAQASPRAATPQADRIGGEHRLATPRRLAAWRTTSPQSARLSPVTRRRSHVPVSPRSAEAAAEVAELLDGFQSSQSILRGMDAEPKIPVTAQAVQQRLLLWKDMGALCKKAQAVAELHASSLGAT